MKALRTLWAVAALSLLATYGCAPSQDEAAPTETDEDALSFGSGSVDHAAIVEVTTIMLIDGITSFSTTLDPYNEADPFKIGGTYADKFKDNLAKFDFQDGVTDWTPEQTLTWTSRVSNGNFLVVDTSKPCDYASPHTYLEIERAQLTKGTHATCGGRMPNEDALDVTLNFLVRGPAASALDDEAIHDGVDEATQKASDAFPYLAELNGWL